MGALLHAAISISDHFLLISLHLLEPGALRWQVGLKYIHTVKESPEQQFPFFFETLKKLNLYEFQIYNIIHYRVGSLQCSNTNLITSVKYPPKHPDYPPNPLDFLTDSYDFCLFGYVVYTYRYTAVLHCQCVRASPQNSICPICFSLLPTPSRFLFFHILFSSII